jgi:hypothetical protein
MELLEWLRNRPSPVAADDFPWLGDGPLAQEHALLAHFFAEWNAPSLQIHRWRVNYTEFASYKMLVGLPPAGQARMAGALVQRLVAARDQVRAMPPSPTRELLVGQLHMMSFLLGQCIKEPLPLSEAVVCALLAWCLDGLPSDVWYVPCQEIVESALRYTAAHSLSATMKELLGRFLPELQKFAAAGPGWRKATEGVCHLLGVPPLFPIEPGEAWSDAALAELATRPPEVRAAWLALFDLCAEATAANPSPKWLKAAAASLARLGFAEFKRTVLGWLALIDQPRTADYAFRPHLQPAGSWSMGERNMDLLRGLAWLCGMAEDRELARALTALTLSTYKRIPRIGPRAVRVGNACIVALGKMPGSDAVGQLAVLKTKIKLATAQIAIEKALTAAATREGLPREEVEEMSVPAYGLTEVGRLVEAFGEFTAELTVTGAKTELTWRKADGKVQKTLPAALKTEFAAELKELNAARKDIEKMLPAQAERLDALFLQQKSWPLATWRERYLDHPLVGTVARRLIWNFTTGGMTTPGLWINGQLCDRRTHPLALEAACTSVALWHPFDQPVEVVTGWRGVLEEWEIRQPFKQAHREVYVLTPAEEQTVTYSNRYASHLLRQHQFHALCQARGWKNRVRQMMGDDTYPPATRRLPEWGLRAELWIEGAGDEYGADTLDSGTFRYVATDQVRFYRVDDAQLVAGARGGYAPDYRQPTAAEPLPLAQVPALVFSEIMRDVDLFVGVTSVGNDPAWVDRGRTEPARRAWTLHSFGELTATALTRRALLERLVPKLKIAARCSFDERFLVVRGDLRTYKIHLGSGNILMSPNDQYLCIVPGEKAEAAERNLFLPFEGDRTLCVILSKAFLLANDAKITDATILRQIRQ